MRAVLVAALVLGLARPAGAQVHAAVLSDSQEALLRQVAAYFDGLRTLKGRFLQVGPDGKTVHGTMWLSRPGRMRFEYDKPSPLLLVASGGHVIFHDASLDQTNDIPVGQTPLGLLLADKISLTGDVTVVAFDTPPGEADITLVRTASPDEGSLTLIMNVQPLALVGWSVVDAQGKETRLRISDVTLGGSFAAGLFTFSEDDQK